MKIALDTNVVLDAILQRSDSEAALEILRKVAFEEIDGLISANAVTDIYYIARKTIGSEKAKEAIFELITLFDVSSVDGEICMDALTSPVEDYEDAVFACCAYRDGADYIATRDVDFINSHSPVKALHPKDVALLID